MFDIGGPEIIALVLLAVVMFGPEKLPTLARKAGRVVRYLGAIANDARGQLRAELGPEFDDFNLQDLSPKNFIQRHLLDSDEVAAVRNSIQDAKEAVSDTPALEPGPSAGGHDDLVTAGVKFDTEAT